MPKSFPNRFQSRWKTKLNFQFTFATLFDEFGPSIWGPKAAENSQKCLRNFFRKMKVFWKDLESRFGRILIRFWEAAGLNFLILQPIFHSDFWKVFEALSIALESISGPEKGPSFASRERSKTLSLIPGGCKFWKMLPKESVTSLLKHFGMQWW